MNIRIGIVGKILRGDGLGGYIKVVDDTSNTGGFLILTSAELSMTNGFDTWVENSEALDRYFIESDWIVDWS